MANCRKRSRCSNWSLEEMMLLADLRKEAFLNKEEGGLVWNHIAQTISRRFPDQVRSGDQCRRRWDTLRRVYNHIEEYCIESEQAHWQLDEEELASMKLNTAYRQDWYNIVRQVCSQRKRKERSGAVKLSKRSNTGSHSVGLLGRTSGRGSLHVTPPPLSNELLRQHIIQRDEVFYCNQFGLGTCATLDQAGRALDVGKYFLCAKKVFYDPNSEGIPLGVQRSAPSTAT